MVSHKAQTPPLDYTAQCPCCVGIGLVATKIVTCKDCEGKGCAGCGVRESGYDQLPWTECSKCIGTGAADENVARSVLGLKPNPLKR